MLRRQHIVVTHHKALGLNMSTKGVVTSKSVFKY